MSSPSTRVPPRQARDAPTDTSLPQLLVDAAGELPSRTAVRSRVLGRWLEVSWSELARRCAALCRGFAQLDIGRADRVAIVAASSPEWVECELAVQARGAASIGIEPSMSPEDLAATLARTGASVVIAGDEEQLDKTLEVRASCPDVGLVVVMNARGLSLEAGDVLSLETVATNGSGSDAIEAFAAAAASVAADALATVVPVGGESGRDVHLSHRALLAGGAALAGAIGSGPDDEVLSYVSLADPLERAVAITGLLLRRHVVNLGGGLASLGPDAWAVQPTILHCPAAVWSGIAAGVEVRMGNATRLKRHAYRRARSAGGRSAWRLVVDAPLRDKLGLSRLRVGLSSGEPLAAPAATFFSGLRAPVVGALARPEAAGAVTVDAPSAPHAGTLGRAVAGVELRAGDGGRIWAQGPCPPGVEAAPAAPTDGWYDTGICGGIDADGFLVPSAASTPVETAP
jgi:long-chain acyl-CoA synthetase